MDRTESVGEPAGEAAEDGGVHLSTAVHHARRGRDLLADHREREAVEAYRRALPYAERAVVDGLGPHTDLVEFHSYVHDMLGLLHLRQSELPQAQEHFTRALDLTCSVTPLGPRVARHLNHLGSVAQAEGDLTEALRRYREALGQATVSDAPSESVASYTSNIGTVLFASGEYDEALRLFRRALEIDERTDPGAAATDLSLIAGVLVERGDLDRARENYERALAIHRAADPDSPETARDLLNVGYVQRLSGDLEGALRHYLAALTIDRAQSEESMETATDLNNISFVHKERGDAASALEYAEAAVAVSLRRAPLSPRTATHLVNLGTVHVDLGQADQARHAFERALAIDRAAAPRSLETARDLNNLAFLASHDDDLTTAEGHWTEALLIFQATVPDSQHTAVTHTNLGTVAHRRNRRAEAAAHFRTALETDRRVLPDGEPTVVDLVNLAVLHEEDGDLDTAVRLFTEAVDIAERLRLRAGPPQARDDRFARDHQLFRNLVHALMQRGSPEDVVQAFSVAERTRVRGLADLVARGAVLRAEADRGAEQGLRALLAEEEDLQRSLLAVHRGLREAEAETGSHVGPRDEGRRRPVLDERGAAPRPGPQTLLGRRHALQERLERLRLRMCEEFPQYAALSGLDHRTLAETRQAVDAGTTLLVHHVGVARSVLWAVRHDGHVVVRVPLGEARLRELVDRALAGCRAGTPPGGDDHRAAADLARALLDPVAGWIPPGQRIIVIPEGPLLHLPWEILPLRDGLLADGHVVSYAPSATVLGALRSSPARPDGGWSRPFAGFGVTGSRAADGPADAGSPLPGSREVELIAGDHGPGAVALTGTEVDREAVRRWSAGAAVVHFATHGVLDDTEPMFSGLLLGGPTARKAPDADGGPAEPPTGADSDAAGVLDVADDDVMRVYEMFGLGLDAEVVVCSGCETALGRMHAGEGLLGMSRALFHAGARCLVVSLWPVPDTPTRRLMRAFHRHLRHGDSPAVALGAAKRQVRRSHPQVYGSPWTWAAFVVVGAGDAITARSGESRDAADTAS
ncbi:tetratricopeptide repeat protein [Streptomyces apricus]|uniref:CHAT domain-containing protein n=1 Tax=Streptomyces apricus TaxID=1828112 RepID=A0A5B0BH05_9ACTN|nr:tetratricopeptide repeat protein [Streptomyces apricus]KAA0940811.1 CHAT domain-containing protein [Streptomyces apricus]